MIAIRKNKLAYFADLVLYSLVKGRYDTGEAEELNDRLFLFSAFLYVWI